MTPTQVTAFTTASGGQAPNAILIVVASIVVVLALVWMSHTVLQLWDNWRTGGTEFGSLAWHVIRGAMILTVLVYFLH